MYKYEDLKPRIFTENAQVEFLKVRDNVQKLLSVSDSFTMSSALKGVYGDSWLQMAFVDRLVELGEIREVSGSDVFGQYRVFVSSK